MRLHCIAVNQAPSLISFWKVVSSKTTLPNPSYNQLRQCWGPHTRSRWPWGHYADCNCQTTRIPRHSKRMCIMSSPGKFHWGWPAQISRPLHLYYQVQHCHHHLPNRWRELHQLCCQKMPMSRLGMSWMPASGWLPNRYHTPIQQ